MFDRLGRLSESHPEVFKEIAIEALQYVLNDCKKNPEKWEPVGQVTNMKEWKSQEGFLRYLDEAIRLAQGKLKESSIDILDFLMFDGGIVYMLSETIDDLHEMGHYFVKAGICIDNATFGSTIFEAVKDYE